MTLEVKMAHLGALIKAKRLDQNLGLRAAANQSGLSSSTLSRLERGIGTTLDAASMAKLSAWLGISVPSLLFEEQEFEPPRDLTTPELVEVHLRADKKLTDETAEALAQMFKMLYDQFASGSTKNP